MKVIVCKASPIQDETVESATIEISRDFETVYPFHGNLRSTELSAEAHDAEAELIVRALKRLPGGTWNRLLVKMLEAHVSVLRVGLFPASNEAEKQEAPCTCVVGDAASCPRHCHEPPHPQPSRPSDPTVSGTVMFNDDQKAKQDAIGLPFSRGGRGGRGGGGSGGGSPGGPGGGEQEEDANPFAQEQNAAALQSLLERFGEPPTDEPTADAAPKETTAEKPAADAAAEETTTEKPVAARE